MSEGLPEKSLCPEVAAEEAAATLEDAQLAAPLGYDLAPEPEPVLAGIAI